MTETRPARRAIVDVPALVVALVAGIAYTVMSVRRFARFEISSWDNAIFEQALQGYARLDAPIVDVKGPGFHILGDHFSPIYALLAPVYRVFPAAQTLLVAQAVLIAVSVYVIGALAARHLGRVWGLVVALMYATSFGVQSAVKAEFHEVAFAAPLLALAGAAWVERRYDRVMWWSLPLLLVKEDLGLTLVVIGGVLWLAGERRRAMVVAISGLAGFAVIVGLVLPAFSDAGSYAYTDTLGGDRGVLTTLFTGVGTKLGTVALTFAIAGFAALWSPWAALVVPTFAWRFLGDVEFYWGTEWHYSLVLMPIVFCAAIDAIVGRPWLRWSVPVGAVVTAVTFIGSPLTELADPDLYRDAPRAASAREAIDLLPPGSRVETDIALLTHVVTDHEAFWTGTIGDVVPDYVLFDVAAGIGSPSDPVTYAEAAYGGTWRSIFSRDGYVLATR